MNLSRLTRVALVAALALPAAAQAQVEALKFEGVKFPGGSTVGGAQTGPYMASRFPFSTAATTFDLYCIDIDHNAKATWTAHYITFADAVTGGTYVTQAQRHLGTEKAWGLADLRAAAYLSTQFAITPQAGWNNIHGAIWSMFSNNTSAAAYAATATAAKGVAGLDASWDQYVLVLDENAFAANYNPQTANLNQAFIALDGNTTIRVVTPEPSTYVLMGMGLLAVGFVSRRRRSA